MAEVDNVGRRRTGDGNRPNHLSQLILEAAGEGIYGVGEDGRISFINPAATRMLGYGSGELVGVDPHALWHHSRPDGSPYAQEDCPIAAAIGRREGRRSREVFWRKDGVRLTVDFVCSPVRGAGRSLRGVVVFRDVTEDERMERLLTESEEKYRSLMEESAEGLYLMDPGSKRILEANPKFLEMFGYTGEEAVGLGIDQLIASQTPQANAERIRMVLAGLKVVNEPRLYRRRDGALLEVEVSSSLVTYGGKVVIMIHVRDVSERRQAERLLAESEERFRCLFDNNSDAVFSLDLKGRFTSVNPAAEKLGGYALGEVRGKPFWFLVEEGDREKARKRFALVATGTVVAEDLEVTIRHRSGRRVPVAVRGIPIASGERISGVFGVARDVSVRVRAERELRLAGKVFEGIAEAVAVTDVDWKIQSVNRAFTEITGYTAEEMTGQDLRFLHPEGVEPVSLAEMEKALRLTGGWKGEMWGRRKNGEVYPQWSNVSAILDEKGRVAHLVSVASDITERRLFEEHLKHLAHHDPLTGLPNRTMFLERLNQSLFLAGREGHQVAVMFLDLDRFKVINDTLGHQQGDLLLRAVADRLRGAVRGSDTVARLGGDEFTVLLGGGTSPGEAALVARKLIAELARPFQVAGRNLLVTGSVGIAMYPMDAGGAEEMLKSADVAMYHAKEEGRNNYQFYAAALNTDVSVRLEMEEAMRRGLEREEFILHYQPQVEVETGRVTGLEALVRWRHPNLGLLTPDRFIPLAEETGLILPLGELVLRAACLQGSAWRAAGLPALRLAVNLSARQFHQDDLPERVGAVLEETGFDPDTLGVELTENILQQNAPIAVRTLEKLRELGVHLAIDDFGTGYSSLGRLKRLPVEELKIDRSFVRKIAGDPAEAAVAAAVTAVGRSLNLNIVAEGVETAEQLAFLRTHGCQRFQGYLFSRPVPGEAVEGLLRDHPAWGQTAR